MELTPEHLQSEHLDPLPLFQSEQATLWHIDTTHPDVVADDHVNARLATATIWSLDEDRTYALLVLREKYTWSDEAIPELLRYLATHLHGSDTAVTETFSVEVFTATAVRSPAGRTVWWREDYVDDAAGLRNGDPLESRSEELRRHPTKNAYGSHSRGVRRRALLWRHRARESRD